MLQRSQVADFVRHRLEPIAAESQQSEVKQGRDWLRRERRQAVVREVEMP